MEFLPNKFREIETAINQGESLGRRARHSLPGKLSLQRERKCLISKDSREMLNMQDMEVLKTERLISFSDYLLRLLFLLSLILYSINLFQVYLDGE